MKKQSVLLAALSLIGATAMAAFTTPPAFYIRWQRNIVSFTTNKYSAYLAQFGQIGAVFVLIK